MFCNKCGCNLESTDRFCQVCGTPVATGQQTYTPQLNQPVYQQPTYQQPAYQQPMYQQPVYQQPAYGIPVSQMSPEKFEEYEEARKKAKASAVFGGIGLGLSVMWFTSIIGLILSIIAVSKSATARRMGYSGGASSAGKGLGIAGIIVGSIMAVYCLIYVIIMLMIFIGTMPSDSELGKLFGQNTDSVSYFQMVCEGIDF